MRIDWLLRRIAFLTGGRAAWKIAANFNEQDAGAGLSFVKRAILVKIACLKSRWPRAFGIFIYFIARFGRRRGAHSGSHFSCTGLGRGIAMKHEWNFLVHGQVRSLIGRAGRHKGLPGGLFVS